MSNETIESIKKTNTGRPPKPKEQKRGMVHSSAYTQAESQRLIERAAKANLPTSVFQREAALNSKVIAKNGDAGLKIGVYQAMVKELRYCRAELHKVERSLAVRDGKLPEVIALKKDVSASLTQVDEVFLCLTIAFRKEIGLDTD